MYSFYFLHMINQYSVFKRFSNQQDQTVPIKKKIKTYHKFKHESLKSQLLPKIKKYKNIYSTE